MSPAPAVTLAPEGLRVAGRTVPLLAGAVHYWRLDPAAWRPALQAVRGLGLHLVDTYVPWQVHERSPGEFDFGSTDPRLAVRRFVETAAEVGLLCCLRPGPHVNAELTGFGVPHRVLWDASCQARSPLGHPVMLPAPPLAFPVPSYASRAFLVEVAQWYGAVGAELSALMAPAGPIVLLQADNEGAFYFRDGVYDQDHHPDAVAAWRLFLQRTHGTVAHLRAAHGDAALTFATARPPRRLTATRAADLGAHLDWAEFQEELLASTLAELVRALAESGLGGVPVGHNLPPGEGGTPLDPERIGRSIELVGVDYYHAASGEHRSTIARRTSELALRADRVGAPPWAAELGAGFPPFFPPLSEADSAFTALSALAYGLRGFNVYMAVDRDRWIGAPIDERGRPQAGAPFWRSLTAAIERTGLTALRRRVEVTLVIPRSLRRLWRVLHGFGPLSAALFEVMGGGAEQGALEDDLDLGAPVAVEARRFLRRVGEQLEQAGVHVGWAAGSELDHALARSRWTVLVSAGALEPALLERSRAALTSGEALSLGPHPPRFDHRFAPVEPLFPEGAGPAGAGGPHAEAPPHPVPPLLPLDDAALAAAVTEGLARLGLGRPLPAPGVLTTLHEDAAGVARALFVLNTTAHEAVAHVPLPPGSRAFDALSGAALPAAAGAVSLELRPHCVRFLGLEPPT